MEFNIKRPLLNAPGAILFALHASILATLVYERRTGCAESLAVVSFSCMMHAMLCFRCFLTRSLEYLLCLFLSSALQTALSARFLRENSLCIRLLFLFSVGRVLAFSALLRFHSAVFCSTAYFLYTESSTYSRSVCFDASLLWAFVEIKFVGLFLAQFEKCYTYAVLDKSSLPHWAILSSSAQLTVCVFFLLYRKANRLLMYALATIWIFYVIYYKIVLYVICACTHSSDMACFRGPLSLFWQEYYILNLAMLALCVLYYVLKHGLKGEAPIHRISYAHRRMLVEEK
ncbi:uncharacterized protein NEMAJ01_1204 [Nematocida major]|uniref:uncharacterized protein n=1 Tax=Nematocida major TaxID=1912982 RepID=UPI00200775CB|nr:uncharacterized protein NEMAJ01_1204 [Nematocida major]KAH9386308.1 hypothetical protein NEMAJ01_1204 [Nematocida major]